MAVTVRPPVFDPYPNRVRDNSLLAVTRQHIAARRQKAVGIVAVALDLVRRLDASDVLTLLA
jgi:hypothetical protein